MLTLCQSATSVLKRVDQAKLVTGSLGASDPTLDDKQNLLYIKALYGMLDGASISYSLIRSFFDVVSANNNLSATDRMHDWMLTPTGLSIAATETIAIISLSLIANIFDDDDKTEALAFIARYWPFLRDGFKGLRNTYRNINGMFKLFNNLIDYDLGRLVLPIGIGLGVLSMANRVLVRYTRAERTGMVKANNLLLAEILRLPSYSKVALAALGPIQYETKSYCTMSLVAATYSGFVDGIYLYMGVLSLITSATPLFAVAVVLSVIFSLLCIASRIYEIYNDQRELKVTQDKIKLALCGKELQALFMQLQEASSIIPASEDMRCQREGLMADIHRKLQEFEEKRADLHATVSLSDCSAFFAGVRGGLAVYGALASLIFASTTVTTLMGIAFPPYLIIVSVFAGLVCLTGIVFYSCITNCMHKYTLNPGQQFSQLVNNIDLKTQSGSPLLPADIKEETTVAGIILAEMDITPSPQVLYQEGSEIWRSLFSGLGKGQKLVDYFLFCLQEQDSQGHYQDTRFMVGMMALSSTVYTAVLAKRAHAAYESAIKRNEASQQLLKKTYTAQMNPEREQPSGSGESDKRPAQSADSPARNPHSMFSPAPLPVPTPTVDSPPSDFMYSAVST